ncbi:winged helix-turn-helix transcriptional regulator [Pseudosporangium ferrugineum]|uniref:HxlR family transcriptional regulator n=1 Tax=Pseudosporangium ferrugineum TaxID=439699 RepID=A0A2T0RJI1_9ACTN|nr:helix-turn-helix domain-containing protein [Pseudosporangium ferrugineum]PRY21345.1 HxlR family transcriptional regulator [Pseudosporangium ferrugineum]
MTASCRSLIDDKWALRIVSALGAGPHRFTELKRAIDGVSQRMLTVTLRSLERDGILTRTVYNVMPPNVSYALTPLGTALLEAATPLLAWTTEALPQIEAARLAYDRRAEEALPAR